MSPDRSAADRLNDHLDAVVTGKATRSHDLDPALSATIEHFFTADDTPGPPPGLADRIWEELVDHPRSMELTPRIPVGRSNRNGRPPLGPRPAASPHHHAAPPHRHSPVLPYLATAALVVLVLLGGLVASRGSLLLVGPEQRAIILPASDLTPQSVRPSDASTDGILLRSRLDQIPPSGGTHQIALNRVHLAPGAVEPAGSQESTGVGVDLFTVESGQVTVEADAPVLLTRTVANSASAPSRVEPETPIMLDVGDQLYAPSGASFRRRNDGSSPATLLRFSIGTVGDQGARTPLPAGVTYDAGLPSKHPPTHPVVPAEAMVQRLTLAPGDELAIRDVPGLQLVYVEAGTLDLVSANAEMLTTPVQALTIRAGSGTESFGPTPEHAVLANRGAEPLVILTASVVSTSAGPPAPEAPGSDGWGTGDHLPATEP